MGSAGVEGQGVFVEVCGHGAYCVSESASGVAVLVIGPTPLLELRVSNNCL